MSNKLQQSLALIPKPIIRLKFPVADTLCIRYRSLIKNVK